MTRVPTARQIIDIIEDAAPKSLAVASDPVGLQWGETGNPVKQMMMALDASLETVSQAVNAGADLLVTHHPLLFEPLTVKTLSGTAGRALALAARQGLSVYSAHTNLDASLTGINAFLADLVGLVSRVPLQSLLAETFKVVVTVPPGHAGQVRAAAFRAGGGRLGDYTGCSFSVDGTGTFRPGEESRPAIGRKGYEEETAEVRIEITTGSENLGAVLRGIREVHPYEEPAIDVYPTVPGASRTGLGLTGELPDRVPVRQIGDRLKRAMKADAFRMVGKGGKKVRKVAVCAGSGASLLDAAIVAGAELYVTGDIKYHDARKAQEAGINILDVGHFAPERHGLMAFGKDLETRLGRAGFELRICYAKEKDPFETVC